MSSEVELVSGCLAGRNTSLVAFVELHQGAIFGLCLRMLRHRHDAEDVTQEVFTRAFRSLKGWDPTRPLRPWLLAIAGNCCRTALAQRLKRPVQQPAAAELPEQEVWSTPDDFSEVLQHALAGLREDYRTCFILFHQQELSIPEIAASLGCPEGTIKTWLHRARKELAEFLRQRGWGGHDDTPCE